MRSEAHKPFAAVERIAKQPTLVSSALDLEVKLVAVAVATGRIQLLDSFLGEAHVEALVSSDLKGLASGLGSSAKRVWQAGRPYPRGRVGSELDPRSNPRFGCRALPVNIGALRANV